MAIRVAVIDSGVNIEHPHVKPIAGGVQILADGTDPDFTDRLGHGTAVAGAIREKAPAAEIYAVKVFDRALVTSGGVLLRALDWCLDEQMHLINLSLGTLNAGYVDAFMQRVTRGLQSGSSIVAAFEMNGQPAFPGSLAHVVGVVLDNECGRSEYRREERSGRDVYAACGYPRDIPGVAPQRNLNGISFAVANVTGFLAAQASPC